MNIHFKSLLFIIFSINTIMLGQDLDLLFINGRIMDGTGNPWYYGDVGIKDGKINYIGRSPDKPNAIKVLDVRDLTISPGFIDIHSHAYDSFREFPDERIKSDSLTPARERRLRPGKNMVAQGVTTLVTNQDGSSGWPILDQISKLEKNGFGPNIILLVGHGSIRLLAMGENFQRNASIAEIGKMKQMLIQGMQEGASGMSAGLEYSPGRWSDVYEMIDLVSELKEYNGIFIEHERGSGEGPMWWFPSSSEPKGQEGILESINETIKIAEATGVTSVCTHIKARGADFWGASSAAINLIQRARDRGVNIWADQYPYNTSGSDGNTKLIPNWVKGENYRKAILRILSKPDSSKILKSDISFEIIRRGGPENILVMEHPKPEYVGKKLIELSETMKKDDAEVAIQLALEGNKDLRGGCRLRGFSMSEVDVEAYGSQPWVMTASDGGLALPEDGFVHARFYGTFPRKIGYYARERGIISIEDAVRSMTSLPANVLGLKNRGILRVGAIADLVFMDIQNVEDKATFFEPHQYPEGIKYVMIGGKFVVKNGKPTGALPGKILTTWK